MPEVITVELLRRRAEHNDGQLHNLQELSLHQSDLTHLNKQMGWSCPRLRILLLQGNMISKIEHLRRLKDIRYLNLAVNTIDFIEGLDQMEFLEKLDFTMNAIDDLLSVENLRSNEHLQELHLIGNPCARVAGYREFVAAVLPQLEELDGQAITAAERQAGLETLADTRRRLEAERLSPSEREQARARRSAEYIEENSLLARTGKDPAAEVRRKKSDTARLKAQRAVPTFRESGEVYQRNEPSANFSMIDDDPASVRLEVDCGKFLDTSFLDVDLHPTWVAIFIKHRALFLNLPDEVIVSAAVAQRSQASGRLVLTMPRVTPRSAGSDMHSVQPQDGPKARGSRDVVATPFPSEFVGRKAREESQAVDIRNIVKDAEIAANSPPPKLPVNDMDANRECDAASGEAEEDGLPDLEDF